MIRRRSPGRTKVPATDPATAGLVATGITRAFRGVQALRGVDLRVARGEVMGLIGPNGAGKSTLVNILTGYDRADQGRILMDGVDLTRTGARERSRGGIARTFQHGHTYAGLTVRENVEVAALGARRSTRQARADAAELLALMGAADRADQPARSLPHGLQRRVGMARALAARPQFLLLDEPAAGLNDGEIGQFGRTIAELAGSQGIGILLIDHNIRLIMSVCDRIHVLVEGKSFLEGTPAEVRGSAALVEAYLGRSGNV